MNVGVKLFGSIISIVVSLTLIVSNYQDGWKVGTYAVAGLLGVGWCRYGFNFKDSLGRGLLLGIAMLLTMGTLFDDVVGINKSREMLEQANQYFFTVKTNRIFYSQGFDRKIVNNFEKNYLQYCLPKYYLTPYTAANNAAISLATPPVLSLLDITRLDKERPNPCMATIQNLASNAPDWFFSMYPAIQYSFEITG
ncbi:hypothetical protein [Kordiimonas sp. SCSIO 12610]|uniref:hypothetical protein n=1 Tax=Kordiimonas sp. SCSIO 12610 TaxID=2829597 RepID=UPI00210C1561|nr:hypothetical protein [Kordiimonas sp. SCSIO 12610]UTW54513.1 hypothetical protein KFF44_11955 [Kordiimonas sp. SCSIO 12610]